MSSMQKETGFSELTFGGIEIVLGAGIYVYRALYASKK